METRYLVLICVMCLAGCSGISKKSPPPLVRQPPGACFTPVPLLTNPKNNNPDTIRAYLIDLIGLYGDARHLHAECSDFVRRSGTGK